MQLRRDVFQAIADPTRRTILLLLAAQPMTAGAIAAQFGSARPTISRHLHILCECELLTQTPQGREVHYHINLLKMKEVSEFIEPFRQLWELRFSKLEEIMQPFQPPPAV